MPSILFNNDNDPLKGKIPENAPVQAERQDDKTEASELSKREDDFAIFPQWDVVPPNNIINPRIKKSL